LLSKHLLTRKKAQQLAEKEKAEKLKALNKLKKRVDVVSR
jgi:hypothetical protein